MAVIYVGPGAVRAVDWAKSHVAEVGSNLLVPTYYAPLVKKNGVKTGTSQQELPAGATYLKKVDCSGLIACSYKGVGIYTDVFPGIVGASTDMFMNFMPKLKNWNTKVYRTYTARDLAKGSVVFNWNKDDPAAVAAIKPSFTTSTLRKGMLLMRYAKKSGTPGHVGMVAGWYGSSHVLLVDASSQGSNPQVGQRSMSLDTLLTKYHVLFSPRF